MWCGTHAHFILKNTNVALIVQLLFNYNKKNESNCVKYLEYDPYIGLWFSQFKYSTCCHLDYLLLVALTEGSKVLKNIIEIMFSKNRAKKCKLSLIDGKKYLKKICN